MMLLYFVFVGTRFIASVWVVNVSEDAIYRVPTNAVRIHALTGGGGMAGSLALMRRPMTLSFFASESMA